VDCWSSCWVVLMGKISQAERWILFVMLHCPPSSQSAKEASSVVLSLCLSELSWHCVSPPAAAAFIHPSPPASCLHTLHRYLQGRMSKHTNTNTHWHARGKLITNTLASQSKSQNLLGDLFFNIPGPSFHKRARAHALTCKTAKPSVWWRRGGNKR